MRLSMTQGERRLQEEVRGFLAEHVPEDLPTAREKRIETLRRWQGLCHEAGYVGRAWPREFGGGGNAAVEQILVDEELAAAGAPGFGNGVGLGVLAPPGAPEFVNVVGLDVLGPSLLRFGTDEQRRRYIPSILSAEEIWSQGFS